MERIYTLNLLLWGVAYISVYLSGEVFLSGISLLVIVVLLVSMMIVLPSKTKIISISLCLIATILLRFLDFSATYYATSGMNPEMLSDHEKNPIALYVYTSENSLTVFYYLMFTTIALFAKFLPYFLVNYKAYYLRIINKNYFEYILWRIQLHYKILFRNKYINQVPAFYYLHCKLRSKLWISATMLNIIIIYLSILHSRLTYMWTQEMVLYITIILHILFIFILIAADLVAYILLERSADSNDVEKV